MTDRTVEAPMSEEATTVRTAPVEPEPARHIGPYRLLRELGHGGMGTVHLAARDDAQYQKRVAIKVVRGVDSADVVRHFRRERQILAALEHPNIARLFDGGTTEDGLPYFVMEYVEGEPIDRFCDARKLTLAERLALFRDVCAAVQHAHRNLVVHRDLKPGNILVTTEGVPKLMDFGIAKILNADLAPDSPTATVLALTPAYASPEQIRGGPITTASDVYSLGVVLYELLTGHRPYRVRGHEPLEVLKAVCDEEPERPSTAVRRTEERTFSDGTVEAATAESVSRAREETPEKLVRRLRGDLDNIALMALRKEPQRRYGSVEALSEDVRRFLEGRPVSARKGTAGYRAAKFVRRHILGVAAAAAFLLLVVAFGVGMAVLRARVAAERDRAEKEAARAGAINAFLLETLGSANPMEGKGRDTTVLEALRLAGAKLDGAFPGQPDVEARVRHTIGLTYLRLGQYADAEPMLRSAVRLIEARGADDPDLAEALNALGILRQERGDLAEAEALFRRALASARRAGGKSAPTRSEVDVLGNLALLLQDEKRLPEAEKLMREILESNRKLLGPDDAGLAIDLNNLGNLLLHEGRAAEAEPLLREAVALFERAKNPGLPILLGNLGEALLAGGRPAEAEPILSRAEATAAERFGETNQDLAKIRVKYAECLAALKHDEKSAAMARAALPVFRASLGEAHEWTRRAARLLAKLEKK